MSSYKFNDLGYDDEEDESSRDRLYDLLEAHSKAKIEAGDKEEEYLQEAEFDAGQGSMAGGMLGGGSLGYMLSGGNPWAAGIGAALGALKGGVEQTKDRMEYKDEGSLEAGLKTFLNPLNYIPNMGQAAAAAPAMASMGRDIGTDPTAKMNAATTPKLGGEDFSTKPYTSPYPEPQAQQGGQTMMPRSGYGSGGMSMGSGFSGKSQGPAAGPAGSPTPYDSPWDKAMMTPDSGGSPWPAQQQGGQSRKPTSRMYNEAPNVETLEAMNRLRNIFPNMPEDQLLAMVSRVKGTGVG